MEKELFSSMALDALGEMMNISLGSSATAASNMLDQRVDITTPTVSVVPVDEFSLGPLEPAMGVEIKYVEGLEGSNIMLLKKSDVKVIVDILMGMETPDEEFELNELTISAVCELMNQMMGSASTALSDFLGYPVNISTPEPFELEELDSFKANHLPQGSETLVVVRFALKIEDALASLGLPTSIPCDAATYAAAVGRDKKGTGADVTAILLDKIGRAVPYKMPKAQLVRLLGSFHKIP
jgi:flagellar motor switch protein FliN/FliY